jgi:hypothetical protein
LEVPRIFGRGWESHAPQPEPQSSPFLQTPSGHDFSHVRAHPNSNVISGDGSQTTEKVPVAKPAEGGQTPEDQTSAETEVESPQPVLLHTQGPDAGTTTACPTKTVVASVTNKAADGIKYRTGMGAVAKMKVEPDSQTWDGTNIVESFPSAATSDCPKEFGINPCSGHSTFPVGTTQTSSVFGSLPATKNHFYDLHETRWKGGSLLHDRNPGGINSCKISCEQNYSCGGAVIGKHTITRTFAKGKVGSVDVTFVTVAKT